MLPLHYHLAGASGMGSNLRPPVYKTDALPSELQKHVLMAYLRSLDSGLFRG